MQKFRLWWTYHSNAIEGNSLTQGETEVFLMEGLTAKGKPLKDHLDLRGHSNAINYLLGFVRDQEVLTEAAIRKLHENPPGGAVPIQAITPDGYSRWNSSSAPRKARLFRSRGEGHNNYGTLPAQFAFGAL